MVIGGPRGVIGGPRGGNRWARGVNPPIPPAICPLIIAMATDLE